MSPTDLNVLVTRPQGQADALVSAIDGLGARASHYPVMRISALSDPERIQRCKQPILALDEYQQVIFISTNAVYFGMEWIEQYWPQLPLGIKWYGIGKRTSEQLSAAAVPLTNTASSERGAMNSEALLQHESLQQLQGQKLLIIRGVGGRDYLQQQLQQRGGRVDYAECYQRSLVDKPLGEINSFIDERGINTLCINSVESLENFCTLLGSDGLLRVKKFSLLVPSKRVAVAAQQAGFENIIQATNASDEAMLTALKHL